MTPEGKVKNQIKRILRKHKAWWCMPATHGYGTSGVQDFVICHRGVFIAVEAKAAGGKLTDLQTIQRDKVLLAGGWGITVRPDTLDSLDGLLETITQTADNAQSKFDATFEAEMDPPVSIKETIN